MKKLSFYGNKNIISERLRLARIKSGLSQSDLAARLQTLNVKIDQQAVSRIEKKERAVTDYELAALCQVLAIPFSSVLKEFDDMQQ